MACDAHASQFYEFTPWANGTLDQVPKDWEGKKKYLLTGWKAFFEVSEEMYEGLEKWYGEAKAKNVKFAEPFEIADYSNKYSDDRIREMFPMFN
ncbi:hypothetical protein [Lederbergia panacisoli]|uniref:hypothetical protein n=1 Tax=Lederbergia panacisoli TaxID=1255251 RepID=UPI00214C200C|nr:hypothetical protein [Lederbergia panacisoli]MCR2823298.1 hypothetical protein [Lederbergia panacisoli]